MQNPPPPPTYSTADLVRIAKDLLTWLISQPNYLVDLQTPAGVKKTGDLTGLATWLLYAWNAAAGSVAPALLRAVIKAFTIDRAIWASAISAFTSELTGVEVPTAQIASSAAGQPLLPFIRAFSSGIGNVIFDAIAPATKPTPEGGKTNAQSVFALATKFGLQGWWMHSIAEAFSLGKLRALGDLPGAVETSFGLQRVVRLLLRTPVKFGISDPLETYYNRLYRPKFLTESQATEAWEKKLIDDDTFQAITRDRGWDYASSQLLLNLHQKDFSLAEITRLWRTQEVDDGFLERAIPRLGYGKDRSDMLAADIRRERLEKVLDETATLARELWRKGELTDAELRTLLTEAHWRAPEIDLLLAHENLNIRNARLLDKTELIEAFQEAVIGEPELRAELRKLRYPDRTIDVLIAIRTKRLTAAQVLDLLIRGRLTEAAATERLSKLGYGAAEIPLLFDLHARLLSEGQILDALRLGRITLQAARQQLNKLGFSDETAGVLLAFTRKELSPADVQAALLRGFITEPDAIDHLLKAGYSRPDAEIIVRLRFHLLTHGEVIDAYDAGLLTRATATNRLLELGFTTEETDLLLRVAELKLARQKRQVPPTGRRPGPS